MTTVDDLIDRVASFFLFMTFPLVMTGGSAITNQPTPHAMVGGTGLTIVELATLLVGLGFVSFVVGLAFVPLFALLPRWVLEWEVSRPTVSVDW